ncbi:MAG TPA: hypothetical protein VFM58_18510, partial [Solirubrobacteraceae bacterium]|nr:hypothetical protein [Solirubrobacteraceae bacterium]
ERVGLRARVNGADRLPHTSTIVDATVLTVIASIILHGLSAGPLTERYTRALRRRRRARVSRPPRRACAYRSRRARWARR